METPAFQTNFLPRLIQVNFLSLKVLLIPALEHNAPAFGLGAAMAGEAEKINAMTNAATPTRISK